MRSHVAGPPGDQDLVLPCGTLDGCHPPLGFKIGPQIRKGSAGKAWKKTGKKQGVFI